MAGPAQGDRAACHARRAHGQSHIDPVRLLCAFAQGGRALARARARAQSDRQRRGHRARHRDLRARSGRRGGRAARRHQHPASRSCHRARGAPSSADGLRVSLLRRGWWSYLVRHRHHRAEPAGGDLCRSHPGRCQARGPAGAGANQVPDHPQPEDRQGARLDGAERAVGRRRRGDRMRRRAFLSLIAGAAAWPLAARAQPGGATRRIGVLLPASSDDAEFQARIGAFLQALGQFGWIIGRNLRIETRWATTDAAEIRRHAAELAALAPDVILAHGASTVGPMLRATRTVPIVFPILGDPVAAGFVESLGRPGGNATGFMTVEYSIGGKWVEQLKQIAPGMTRAAVIRDSASPTGIGQFGAIQTAAPSFAVELRPLDVRDAPEIERAVAAFARAGNGGMIVTPSALAQRHRDLLIALAERHRLPALYPDRSFVANGGLVSYGADYFDQYRRAAGYVDRILRGEKAADLPVQMPTRYELVINLKTAKALGLDLPATVLASADEVIE